MVKVTPPCLLAHSAPSNYAGACSSPIVLALHLVVIFFVSDESKELYCDSQL